MPFKLNRYKTIFANETHSNNLIQNLSSIKLSETDKNLLGRGLTFIPTPKLLPISTILENKNRLIRNVKIKCAFKNKTSDKFDPKKKTFTEKSDWIPSNAQLFRNGTLHDAIQIINKIEKFTTEIIEKQNICTRNSQDHIILKEKFNLSQKEFAAINKFNNNAKLTIKPADKGGALVLMDTENYLQEAYRQLNDNNYHKKLSKPIYPINKIEIKNILISMFGDGFISEKQLQYLSGPADPRPGVKITSCLKYIKIMKHGQYPIKCPKGAL